MEKIEWISLGFSAFLFYEGVHDLTKGDGVGILYAFVGIAGILRFF